MAVQRAHATAIAAALIWGTSFPAMAITLGGQDMDPFFLTAARMALAASLAVSLLAARRRLSVSLFRNRWVWVLGALNAGAFALQHYGVALNASSAKTALIVNVNVVFVALLSVRMFGERLDARRIAAVASALFGLFALTIALDPAFFGAEAFRGDLFILLSSLVWTPYILYTKVAVRDIDPLDLVCGALVITAVLLLPTLALADFTAVPAAGLWGVLYLGLAVTLPPLALYTQSMRGASATVVSILTLTEVVFGAFLGFLLLQERFVAVQVGGAGLMLLGMYLALGEAKGTPATTKS